MNIVTLININSIIITIKYIKKEILNYKTDWLKKRPKKYLTMQLWSSIDLKLCLLRSFLLFYLSNSSKCKWFDVNQIKAQFQKLSRYLLYHAYEWKRDNIVLLLFLYIFIAMVLFYTKKSYWDKWQLSTWTSNKNNARKIMKQVFLFFFSKNCCWIIRSNKLYKHNLYDDDISLFVSDCIWLRKTIFF